MAPYALQCAVAAVAAEFKMQLSREKIHLLFYFHLLLQSERISIKSPHGHEQRHVQVHCLTLELIIICRSTPTPHSSRNLYVSYVDH